LDLIGWFLPVMGKSVTKNNKKFPFFYVTKLKKNLHKKSNLNLNLL